MQHHALTSAVGAAFLPPFASPLFAPTCVSDSASLLSRIIAARKGGQLQAARRLMLTLPDALQANTDVVREKVNLRFAFEEFAEAEQELIAYLAHHPNERWAWQLLGLACSHTRNTLREVEALKQALALEPDEAYARRLYQLQQDNKDTAGSLETVRLLRSMRDTPELELAEARLHDRLGDQDTALTLTSAMLERRPTLPAAIEHWASLLMRQTNGPEHLVEQVRQRLHNNADEPEYHVALARALAKMDQAADAIKAYEEALSKKPDTIQWWYELGIHQRQSGLIAESQQSLQRIIALEPLDATVLRVHGAEHTYSHGDPYLRHINQALASIEQFPLERQVELHYAAAKAYEDVGELEVAYQHYATAGLKQAKVMPYKHRATDSLLRMLRQGVNARTFAAFQEPRCQSDLPVFVLGMPRSGTTLVEQIIASHPQAYGAGELKLLHRVLDGVAINGQAIHTEAGAGVVHTYIPGLDLDCRELSFQARGERYVQGLQALAAQAGCPEVARVVDKMPGNYFWAGLIPFILPAAHVIHTRRHPMDCCLSNYRIFFPDGMPWSYDQRALGRAYRSYHEHMQHWQQELAPSFMYSVMYEALVANAEHYSRQLIEHIGLEWNPDCLRFYENTRSVKTASLNQVRKPIYSSSVRKWEKYKDYLQPLYQELKPICDAYEQELAAL